jgi:hypothetical protein
MKAAGPNSIIFNECHPLCIATNGVPTPISACRLLAQVGVCRNIDVCPYGNGHVFSVVSGNPGGIQQRASQTGPLQRLSFCGGGDLNGSLKLKEWIVGSLAPIQEAYLTLGHHKSPKGGAASVGQKGASALKQPSASIAAKFLAGEPPPEIDKAVKAIAEL